MAGVLCDQKRPSTAGIASVRKPKKPAATQDKLDGAKVQASEPPSETVGPRVDGELPDQARNL